MVCLCRTKYSETLDAQSTSPKEQQQRLAAKVDFTQVWCGINRIVPSWSANDVKDGKSWSYLHWIMSLGLCWWEPFSMNASMRIPLSLLMMTSHLFILFKEIIIHQWIIPLYLRQLEFTNSIYRIEVSSLLLSVCREATNLWGGCNLLTFSRCPTFIYIQ